LPAVPPSADAKRRSWRRGGIATDRSILAFWVGYAAAEIKPLWRLMRQELRGSTKSLSR
jgi:transposase